MGSTLLPLVDTHDIISAVNKLCHSWLHRPHHRQRYSQGLKTPAKWQAASLSSTCSSVLHFYPGFLNPLISWMKHTVLWTSISSLTIFYFVFACITLTCLRDKTPTTKNCYPTLAFRIYLWSDYPNIELLLKYTKKYFKFVSFYFV